MQTVESSSATIKEENKKDYSKGVMLNWEGSEKMSVRKGE